jgi:hypothetical protein
MRFECVLRICIEYRSELLRSDLDTLHNSMDESDTWHLWRYLNATVVLAVSFIAEKLKMTRGLVSSWNQCVAQLA